MTEDDADMVYSCTKDLPDNTVGTLPKLLSYVISLVDDKVLIEDLEVLPTLEFPHRCGAAADKIAAL